MYFMCVCFRARFMHSLFMCFFVVKQMNSTATSDGWKLLDPRNHKKPFSSRFVTLLSSSDIGEWTSYDLRKYIDTKFQVLQSNFVVFWLLDKKALKKHLACGNHSHRSGIGLNLWQAKVFKKWGVWMFRIGASRRGANFDRFRERNVMFFSLSTSGVWKQVDPRIHR